MCPWRPGEGTGPPQLELEATVSPWCEWNQYMLLRTEPFLWCFCFFIFYKMLYYLCARAHVCLQHVEVRVRSSSHHVVSSDWWQVALSAEPSLLHPSFQGALQQQTRGSTALAWLLWHPLMNPHPLQFHLRSFCSFLTRILSSRGSRRQSGNSESMKVSRTLSGVHEW